MYQQHPAAYQPSPEDLAPTVATTIVITLLFGVVFGWIPALVHTNRARRLGYRTSKYWGAYGIIAAVWLVLVIVLAASSSGGSNAYGAGRHVGWCQPHNPHHVTCVTPPSVNPPPTAPWPSGQAPHLAG
jgi:hypothetical protein